MDIPGTLTRITLGDRAWYTVPAGPIANVSTSAIAQAARSVGVSLAVAGGEDAQAPCLEVEGGGIATPGQRMHDDDNLELGTLKAVGGIDRDMLGVLVAGASQGGSYQIGLIAVCDANRDVGSLYGPTVAVASQVAIAPRSNIRLARLAAA